MNIEDLIPKNKSDFATLAKLEKLQYPEYKKILPELFSWIQDMNWPIAKKIAPLLVVAKDGAMPIIKTILLTDDYIWQYWTLAYVVAELPLKNKNELVPLLKKISANPTTGQKEEEVDRIIQEILQKITSSQ